MNLDEQQLAEMRQRKEQAMKKAKEEEEAFKKACEADAAAENDDAATDDKKKKKKSKKKKNAKGLAAFMDDDKEADAFKQQVDEELTETKDDAVEALETAEQKSTSMLIEEVEETAPVEDVNEAEEE